jgi:hypothetical protein
MPQPIFWHDAQRFQRIFNVFLWPGAWEKLRYFLLAVSPDSVDLSINHAKTPRYGKSTVVSRKNCIHRMLMIRVSARPLRMRENFLFYEYSIFNFVMSRCILHFLGENRTHAIWQPNVYYFRLKSITLIMRQNKSVPIQDEHSSKAC